jgi:hypothetical protein
MLALAERDDLQRRLPLYLVSEYYYSPGFIFNGWKLIELPEAPRLGWFEGAEQTKAHQKLLEKMSDAADLEKQYAGMLQLGRKPFPLGALKYTAQNIELLEEKRAIIELFTHEMMTVLEEARSAEKECRGNGEEETVFSISITAVLKKLNEELEAVSAYCEFEKKQLAHQQAEPQDDEAVSSFGCVLGYMKAFGLAVALYPALRLNWFARSLTWRKVLVASCVVLAVAAVVFGSLAYHEMAQKMERDERWKKFTEENLLQERKSKEWGERLRGKINDRAGRESLWQKFQRFVGDSSQDPERDSWRKEFLKEFEEKTRTEKEGREWQEFIQERVKDNKGLWKRLMGLFHHSRPPELSETSKTELQEIGKLFKIQLSEPAQIFRKLALFIHPDHCSRYGEHTVITSAGKGFAGNTPAERCHALWLRAQDLVATANGQP